MGKRPLTWRSLKKNYFVLNTHANAPLQSCLSKRQKSWDSPNLELEGFVSYGDKNGYASLLVSDKFSTIKRSWETEEICTAIHFRTTMVMTVYAPDSKKNLEMYEECISSVVKLREGRKGGAQDFYIAGNFNVEKGLMCTDENDEEELTKLLWSLMLARVRQRP